MITLREPTPVERQDFRAWIKANMRRLSLQFEAAQSLSRLYDLTGFYQGHRLHLQTNSLTNAVHDAERKWEELR